MFQWEWAQRPFKSIDLPMRSFCFLFFSWENQFAFQNWRGCCIFRFSNDFLIFSIPRAPSRSNHYVDKVGGYHRILICTLNPPDASPWIETCPFLSIRVVPSSPIIGLNEQSADSVGLLTAVAALRALIEIGPNYHPLRWNLHFSGSTLFYIENLFCVAKYFSILKPNSLYPSLTFHI